MLDPTVVRLVVVVTFFGFIALAVALLLPVYLFMRREETRGEQWNDELRKQGRLRKRDAPPASVQRDEGA